MLVGWFKAHFNNVFARIMIMESDNAFSHPFGASDIELKEQAAIKMIASSAMIKSHIKRSGI
jgi:hypothetical protein